MIRLGRCVAALILLAPAALVAEAAAASPQVTIGVGADPTESITTQLSATGSGVSGANELVMTVKPSGGEGCGANRAADKGTDVLDKSGTGAFTATENRTFETAGSYLLCAWMRDLTVSEAPVIASSSMTIVVRPPHISLSLTVPAIVRPDQAFQLSLTAQSETERLVLSYIVPNTGRGCPANASAAASTAGEQQIEWPSIGSGWRVTGGPFTQTISETFSSTGGYLVCAYAEYPSTANVPEAGATATFSVVQPPPPCTVPRVSAGTSLSRVERKLLAAHCRAGKIRRLRSHRRRGTFLALSPRAGTKLPNGSAVTVLISAGRRHR